MKRKIYFTCYLIALSLLSSCNYLDVIPDNIATVDMIFRTRANAEKLLFTCYGYLPEHGNVNQNPGLGSSEEVWNVKEETFYYTNTNSFRIAKGLQNVDNPYLNYWNGDYKIWKGIRDCNIFLDNLHKVPDLEYEERSRWLAEVMVLKAYYHYWQFQLYGPIPFIDGNLDVAAPANDLLVVREPVDVIVPKMVKLIDDAIALEGLPLNITSTLTELGRLTKPAALSIKAKILVLAASPLFNGNKDFPSYKNEEGVELINTVEDPKKWEAARDALKIAIDACHEAGHELYEFNEPMMMQISDTTRLELTIRNTLTGRFTKELVWGAGDAGTAHLTKISNVPLDGYHLGNLQTWVISMHSPTLDVAEQFYTNKGLPIDYDKTWDYDSRYEVNDVPEHHEYYIQANTRTANLHFNREPRFYASVGFDTGKWFNMEHGSGLDSYAVFAKNGEVSGLGKENHSITGYFAKKLVSYELVLTESSNTSGQISYAFPIVRLGDLYLLYAEALNETKATPDAEVYEYIQKVRDKAGLDIETGSLLETWVQYSNEPLRPKSKAGMREIIHQERLIELSFEGQRFFDLRRWKKSFEYCNRPIRGWNSSGKTEEDFYKVTYIYSRKFSPRDYFWPIPIGEMYRNKNLIQSPLW